MRSKEWFQLNQLRKGYGPKLIIKIETYFDVGGTFWKNHFKGEVLGKDRLKVVITGIIENKSSILIVPEEMETGRNIVSLAPIDLPLAHDRETGLNSKAYFILIAVCV